MYPFGLGTFVALMLLIATHISPSSGMQQSIALSSTVMISGINPRKPRGNWLLLLKNKFWKWRTIWLAMASLSFSHPPLSSLRASILFHRLLTTVDRWKKWVFKSGVESQVTRDLFFHNDTSFFWACISWLWRYRSTHQSLAYSRGLETVVILLEDAWS